MKFDYSYITEKKINKDDKLIKNVEPIISIITAFYNGGKYIEDTAKAVLNQTYPYFEWIIVDDGSTDESSLEKLKLIEKMDNRIKVVHKENSGQSYSRDYGVKISSKSSKYIMFLDDDDIISNNYLECAYWTLETNSKASWAFSDVINFGEINALAISNFEPEKEKKENRIVLTALIRKDDFIKVGGFDLKEKGIYEDWNLWLKMIGAEMFPVRMSFFGFWYRRKQSKESELAKSKENNKIAKKIIEETAKKITKTKPAIQYPKQDYNYDIIKEKLDNIIIPKYQNNNKVKILMIIPWIVMGGADKFNIDFINGLDKNKFEITVITTEPSINPWKEKMELNTRAIYELPSFIDKKYWVSFINYIIEKNNIDIVFNTNSTFGYSVLPNIKSEFPNIPIIDYVHMEEWYNRNGGFSRDSSSVASVIDKTFVCNENSRKILINHFKRNPDEVKTVYIGVDEKKFDPSKYDKQKLREKYEIDENKKVISFIARIDYQKRPFLFLEIAKKVLEKNDDIIFVVAGSGPLLDDIISKSKKYGIYNKIKFLGAIKNTEEIYSISDLTLNCSIKEGLALTAYESLSMGVPVISSNVGGQAELIDNNVGVIVECLQDEKDVFKLNYSNKEIDSYVTGIEKILSNLEKYKENSRKKIINGFTINQMIDNMTKELINIKNKPNNAKKQNGENLKNDKDICSELITKYFMAFNNEYNWLCTDFNKKICIEVGKSCNDNIKLGKRTKIGLSIKRMAIKLHIYNEIMMIAGIIKLIFNFIKNIIKLIFNFIKNIIKMSLSVVIMLLKNIIYFIILIFVRIINIFRKIFKKEPIEFNEIFK